MAVITILDNNTVNWRIIRIALDKHGQDGTTVAIVKITLDFLPVWTHLCIWPLQDSNVRDRVQSNIAATLRCGKVGKVEVHKTASGVFVEVLSNLSVAGNGAIVLWAGGDLDVCYRGDACGCIDTKPGKEMKCMGKNTLSHRQMEKKRGRGEERKVRDKQNEHKEESE